MLKKHLITFFFFFFFFFFLYFTDYANAQEVQKDYKVYHELLLKARSFDDRDSIIFYSERAFSLNEPFPYDLRSLAFQYYKKNDLVKADSAFVRSVCSGYQLEPDDYYDDLPFKINYNSGQIESYKNSNNVFGDFIKLMYQRNKEIIKRERENFLKNIDRIDNETYEVLLQNEFDFQNVRLKILPNNKQVNDSIYTLAVKYLNTGNSYIMLDLLRDNKFPKRRNCRRFNAQNITMLLNHAIAGFVTKEDAKEFIDLLWGQVENGNITPRTYALTMDHYIHWYVDSDKTLLGTTTYMKDDFKTVAIKNVLYPRKLNELREQYWMNSIEEFCESVGYELPENYTDKE